MEKLKNLSFIERQEKKEQLLEALNNEMDLFRRYRNRLLMNVFNDSQKIIENEKND